MVFGDGTKELAAVDDGLVKFTDGTHVYDMTYDLQNLPYSVQFQMINFGVPGGGVPGGYSGIPSDCPRTFQYRVGSNGWGSAADFSATDDADSASWLSRVISKQPQSSSCRGCHSQPSRIIGQN